MPVRKSLANSRVLVYTNDICRNTEAQLERVAELPFIFRHVAAMPDAHLGKGSTVGSVIPTRGAIIPAAVGVDIGCGMMAVKTDLRASDLPDELADIRTNIERGIPHGRSDNGGPKDIGSWKKIPRWIQDVYNQRLDINSEEVGIPVVLRMHPAMLRTDQKIVEHLGTLGTGNHFIEVSLDENNAVWVVLHSGSRGVGNRIGSYFTDLAKKTCEKYFIQLPDPELAFLVADSHEAREYLAAVTWAQKFAAVNREVMMRIALGAIAVELGRSPKTLLEINCHHNYIDVENHFGANVFVTRKGAIRARKGDLGIIPGSMGAKSFIVSGLGDPTSFTSCSHGAGRSMSRGEAKRIFSERDLELQTAGIECRKDAGVIDEIPAAYKDIDTVMENQADLVEVLHTLRQIVNIKG